MIKNLKLKIKNSSQGFTLIEILVIITITTILAGIMIAYGHIGEKQITLFRDQAKIIGVLNRAKFLTVQMFAETGEKPCAYGVHFENNKQTFLIFKDLKTSCDGVYGGDNSGELFEKYEINSAFKFETSLSNVVFIPPDPRVKLNAGSLSEATIKIVLDATNYKTIRITKYGQITVE